MARTPKEAILIVLDVGPSVGHEISFKQETFLSNAQLCATKIIQRKILSQSKDEIGLIILGSEETNNPLADDTSGYSNIEISHSLQLANWNMVQTIAGYKQCTSVDGDWLDALIVAADYMKTATADKTFKERKIVMLTNFRSNVSDDEIESVIKGLQTESMGLIVIGPQVYTSNSQEIKFASQNKSEEQEEGEKLIARIVDALETSVICSFEDALSQLQFFGQRKVRPAPWNTVMDIGSNIKIPIQGYKKIATVQRMKMHDIIIPCQQKTSVTLKQEVSDLQANSIDPQTDIDMHENQSADLDFNIVDKDRIYSTAGDNATHVDVSDLIEGFMFGSTVVPVTADDMPGLSYVSGPRCLSVLGFTNKSYVPMHIFRGECSQIFPKNTENSIRAFAALIQAMDSKNMVAIARKVYNNNNCPVMCALFPLINPEFQCFVSIELPFSEQIVTLLFPPLVSEKPTSEQLEAVDQLISSMDLMTVDDDEENGMGAYNPETTLDPYEQHFYNVVARKALNGDLLISASEVDEAVKQLLSPKEELLEAAQPALNKIKDLFPLIEVTPKEGARKAAADLFKTDSQPANQTDTTTSNHPSVANDDMPHIGTVRPQEDFQQLLSTGVPLEKACGLLQHVIMDMILKGFDADDYNKPYKSLVFMRNTCKETSPYIYNEWIMKFKNELPTEKAGFWDLIVKDKAGLITLFESKQSKITAQEAEKFLQVDKMIDELPPTQLVNEDDEDLIMQM